MREEAAPQPRSDPDPEPAGRRALAVVVAVTATEGLLSVAYGAWLLRGLLVDTPSNEAVAQGSAAYFVGLGVLVLGVAEALRRRHGWALGAALFLQVLVLPIAVTMVREGAWYAGVPLGLAALVGLVSSMSADARASVGR